MEFKFGDTGSTDDVKSKKNTNVKAKKILKVALICVAVLIGLFIFFNYLFVLFLPFIIAWLIAFFIQPVVQFMHAHLRLPKRLATVLILMLIFIGLGFVIFLLIDRIIYELTSLSQTFKIDSEAISEYIDGFFAWLEGVLDKIPFLSGSDMMEQFQMQIEGMIESFLNEMGTIIVSKVPSIVTSTAVKLPSFLIFTLILIVSTFYICLDYAQINKFIMLQIPKKIHTVLFEIKNKFLEAIYKYLRAYAIIIFITYFELAVGFLIIGVNYAFLLAIIVALVDILPVMGTGTILIPWGIIMLFQKDYFTGFALLILYATVTIIRQIIEPKIVGKSIGLYPVVTLIALYSGYRIFGVAGMFLLPICILLLKNLNEEGKIKLWKNMKKTEPENKEEVTKIDKSKLKDKDRRK